jgi:hypothetical protein
MIIPIIREMPLAGVTFRSKDEQAKAYALPLGTDLSIELEPTNAHDKFAAKVLTQDGVWIGYLPRTVAGIAYLLDATSRPYCLRLVSRKAGALMLSLAVDTGDG